MDKPKKFTEHIKEETGKQLREIASRKAQQAQQQREAQQQRVYYSVDLGDDDIKFEVFKLLQKLQSLVSASTVFLVLSIVSALFFGLLLIVGFVLSSGINNQR
jgi:hypothetical protein